MKLSEKSWYGKGFVLIPLGLLLILNTKTTAQFLVIILGIYLLTEGTTSLFDGFTERFKANTWALDVFKGIIYLLLSIFTLTSPLLFLKTTLSYVFDIIAVVIIFLGIIQIIAVKAYKRKKFLFTGVSSILIGLILIAKQLVLMLILTKIVGVLLLLYGLLLFFEYKFKLKDFR